MDEDRKSSASNIRKCIPPPPPPRHRYKRILFYYTEPKPGRRVWLVEFAISQHLATDCFITLLRSDEIISV